MGKISIRLSKEEDVSYLIQWLMEPGVLQWFPMDNRREVEISARIQMSYIKEESAFTACIDGKPCGMANLYLNSFKKLSHQCLFAIIVGEKYRNQGIGTMILKEMIYQGREKFHLDSLLLEVYENNPAISLYRRFDFKEYGRQERFLKKDGQYLAKIFMQKKLDACF